MDRDEVEVHKNAKKNRKNEANMNLYNSTEQAWSIKSLLYGQIITPKNFALGEQSGQSLAGLCVYNFISLCSKYGTLILSSEKSDRYGVRGCIKSGKNIFQSSEHLMQ